jgi:SNF2 family DNA or RNA helicase
MTELLNILEDYVALMEFPYVRFDGSTKLADRQAAIEEFNREDSNVFLFLLSTRSGGLGVNLAAADTVILFDRSVCFAT